MEKIGRRASQFLSASLDEIDQAIAETKQHLQDLNIIRNGKLPISRLPPELLAHIFTIYVNAWVYEWSHFMRHGTIGHDVAVAKGPFYRWIYITHVCERWYSVALATPALWRFITPCQPMWMERCLDRAKEFPLAILLREPLIFDEDHIMMLRLHRERIASVDFVHNLGHQHKPIWLKLFALRLPSLRQLTLQHILVDEHDGFSRGGTRKYVLDFIARNSGKVERATLFGMPAMTYVRPVFQSHLKHLVLGRSPASVKMSDLLTCLEASPSLETLVIQYAIPSVPYGKSDLPPVNRTATLPHLRYLKLVGFGSSPMNLFNHLQHPSTTRVVLVVDLQYDPHFFKPNTVIVPIVQQRFVKGVGLIGSSMPILTSTLQMPYDEFRLVAWTEDFNTLTIPFPPLLDLRVTSMGNWITTLAKDLRHLNLGTTLRNLQLAEVAADCLPGVLDMLTGQSQLKTIHLNDPLVRRIPILSSVQIGSGSLHVILGPTHTRRALDAIRQLREMLSTGRCANVTKITFQSLPLTSENAYEVNVVARNLAGRGIILQHVPLTYSSDDSACEEDDSDDPDDTDASIDSNEEPEMTRFLRRSQNILGMDGYDTDSEMESDELSYMYDFEERTDSEDYYVAAP